MCRKAFVFALISILLVLACENPFKTRKSKPPIGANINWTPPSEPRLLLVNFTNSVNAMNIAYYMRCLNEEFSFIADEHERSDFNPDSWKFREWNYTIEQEVMSRLFNFFRDTIRPENQIFEISLLMTDEPDIESPHDSVQVYRDYEMSLYHNYSDYPAILGGTFEFTMKEDESGFWNILRMRDTKKDTTDWGEFKGIFRY